MKLTEFDCDESEAVRRMAFNPAARELIVQFRSNGRVHLYIDLPPHVNEDMIHGSSKGELVSDVKKVAKCRQISNFPRKVKMYELPRQHQAPAGPTHPTAVATSTSNNKKKKYHDYSHQWIRMMHSPEANDRDFMGAMQKQLLRCRPKHPPNKPPPGECPQVENPQEAAGIFGRSQPFSAPDGTETDSSQTNAFSALSLDTDTDSSNSDSEDDTTTSASDMKEESMLPASGLIERDSIQTRYLFIKLVCRFVECIRREADIAQRKFQYHTMTNLWEEAWLALFDCQVSIDEWFAILVAYGGGNDDDDTFIAHGEAVSDKLPNGHSRSQLQNLFTGLQLLVDDTERQRDGALRFLHRRLQFVEQKLNPMIQERDYVKRDINETKGHDYWTSNPTPKQNYAERRKQWEIDLKHISEAIVSIEKLNFTRVLQFSDSSA